MRLPQNKAVRYTLAGFGVVYIVLFAGYLVYAATGKPKPSGPSELEAHPEKQDQILAVRRAQELQDRLKLTDDQTDRIADIFYENRRTGQPLDTPPDGNFRGRWQQMQDQIKQVLTPEQAAQADSQMNQFLGPNGPGQGFFSPERVQDLKSQMTPEQQAKFQAKLDQWSQRRQQGGGRGGRQFGR